MADRPILVFPTKEDKAERAARSGGAGADIALPSRQLQGVRIGRKFAELARQLRQRRFQIQEDPAGAHPSEIVVFELAGTAPDFYNALRRINGLGWLMDTDLGESVPDEQFYDVEKQQTRLRRRLLAVSVNRQALAELIQLFRMYRRGETLPRNFGAFTQLFAHIRDVRPWQFQDRVLDTGLDIYLQEQLDLGVASLTCSIELFSTGDRNNDTAALARVSGAIQNVGELLASALIPEIRHIELRARIDITGIRSIVDLEHIQLFRLDEVMFVRPRAQALVEFEEIDEGIEIAEGLRATPVRRQPRIAMLDGVPIQNHPLLAGYVVLDDPDGFEALAAVQDRIHGTGMVSLVVHGDLGENLAPLNEMVYIRPIMLPRRTLHSTTEEIPEDYLPIDLVHRSILRLFGPENAAPDVRVVCLCVGDLMRPLDWYASPWAKLLDFLTWKYGVLFIVSAGNHPANIQLNIPSAAFPATPITDIEEAFLARLIATTGDRPILSPAEAINVITVGAGSSDAANLPPHVVAPFVTVPHDLPTPYTALGGGIGRMVKPEVYMSGGRVAFQLDPMSPADASHLRPLANRSAPGHEVASPPRSRAHLKGTSNAAALLLRASTDIMDAIAPAVAASSLGRLEEAALIKAMLIHSASWGDARETIGKLLTNVLPQALRTEVAHILGYGFARPERVVECTAARITVIAAGKIKEGRSVVFRFPLPPSLASRVAIRTITTTLASLCPIVVTNRKYRSHNVWLSHAFRDQDIETSLRMKSVEAHDPLVSRGTVQHLIFRGRAATAFVDGDFLELRVNCMRDAGERVANGIPFGLVATLDVQTDLGVDLYAEVRERIDLATAVQIRADAR